MTSCTGQQLLQPPQGIATIQGTSVHVVWVELSQLDGYKDKRSDDLQRALGSLDAAPKAPAGDKAAGADAVTKAKALVVERGWLAAFGWLSRRVTAC